MNQQDDILKAIKELAVRENDYAIAAVDFAEKEAAYRLAKASEFLLASGTVAEREAIAAKKIWEVHKAKLSAEAILEIMKQKLQDVRAVISARQSILSAESKNNLMVDKFTT